jgi:amidase
VFFSVTIPLNSTRYIYQGGYSMALANELAAYDLSGTADLIRCGEIKPEEAIETAIERIERFNPQYNAVVTPMFDSAMDQLSKASPSAPLYGVPYLLKDLMAECQGVRLTEGSRYLEHMVSDHDSELVLRLKQAGLIILGKTNTGEFGLLPTTESELLGPCRNPWDRERTPGGSSGGAATAVACGMVPAAHGNDGGGSIRIPASCTGLFGLKPTRGRNPMGPDLGDALGGLGVEHAVTRMVRDSALLLDITAGPSTGDPYWAPPIQRPFINEVQADPGQLRIGWSWDTAFGVDVHPDCKAAVKDAVSLLADLGHRVEEAIPEYDAVGLAKAYGVMWGAGCAWGIEYWHRRGLAPEPSPEFFEPFTWAMYERGQKRSAADWLMAVTTIQKTSRQAAQFFVDYDVYLTPTLAQPPLSLGVLTSTKDDPMACGMKAAFWAPYTALANASGQPAMSVPLYWNADNLPIGCHFMSGFGNEAVLFRLAAQLEAARPWKDRRPSVII